MAKGGKGRVLRHHSTATAFLLCFIAAVQGSLLALDVFEDYSSQIFPSWCSEPYDWPVSASATCPRVYLSTDSHRLNAIQAALQSKDVSCHVVSTFVALSCLPSCCRGCRFVHAPRVHAQRLSRRSTGEGSTTSSGPNSDLSDKVSVTQDP